MTDRRRRKAPKGVNATMPLEDAPLLEHVERSVRAQFRPVLVVMSGDRVGHRAVVDGNVLVGRDPEAELCLDDAGVSWHHSFIEDRGGGWAVVDQGSTNGTSVNGTRITEQVLEPGDKIVFGETIVRFEVQDAADRAYDEVVARMISIDDLSGLFVRRRFDAELKTLISDAGARGGTLGLLVMDLDGIKAINDAHGHAFGAYVIGEAGRLIGRVLDERGIACRWGGDEYMAALPDHDLMAAAAVGEEIRARIAEHPFERENIRLRPGISIGVSAFPERAQDPTTLFREADAALYRAKRAGKNRVSE